MSIEARVRASWPTTLLMHGYKTGLATVVALPILGGVADPVLSAREPVAQWISALQLGAALGERGPRALALPLLAAALLTPWLTLAWFSSLERAGSPAEHLRAALPRYRASCAIALVGLAYLGLLALAASGVSLVVRAASAGLHDARTGDLLLAAALAPLALAALHGLTVQDAAQAALPVQPGGSSVRAALRAGLARTRPPLVALRVALVLVQGTLGLFAWSVPRLGLGSGLAADAGVLLATQAAALAFTWLRAYWLATILGPRASTPELETVMSSDHPP
jgi:hypothetical protein